MESRTFTHFEIGENRREKSKTTPKELGTNFTDTVTVEPDKLLLKAEGLMRWNSFCTAKPRYLTYVQFYTKW